MKLNMISIEEIIKTKPHLEGSLKFYEKVLKFETAVHELPSDVSPSNAIPVGLDHVSYPPELVKPVFDRFTSFFDVPADMLAPLRDAMESGRIDLTRLPMNEVPSFALPYQENDLATLLYLIGRPYFRWVRKKFNLDNMFWQEGKCPVCNSVPALATIKEDEGRTLYCPFCGGQGRWKRIGCPHCQNEDGDKIEVNVVEGDEGFRVNFCKKCKAYLKTVNAGLLGDYTPDLLDIVSLPLDIIAQEKGYRRFSPNPLGLTVMA